MLIIAIIVLIANLGAIAFGIHKISEHREEDRAKESAHYHVVVSLQQLLVSLSEFTRKLSGTEVRSLEEMRVLLTEIRIEKAWVSNVLHAIKALRTDITNWRNAEKDTP